MLPDSFPCVLVAWEEAARLARLLSDTIRMSGYRPDLVIAIGRGGFVPARVVCDQLLLQMLTSMKIEHWGIAATKKEKTVVRFPLSVDVKDMKVLIIDDITDTGETLEVAVEYVSGRDPADIRTGVLQHKYTSAFTPDYFAEYLDEWSWVIYPWAVHEDLVGFVERVLSKGPGSFGEVDRRLRERFEIRVSEEALSRALDELAAMGWVERRDQDYHAVREA